MKICVFTLPENKNAKKRMEEVIKKDRFFMLTQRDPEVVISLGGDGTLFFAERRYPGVPKMLLRKSEICVKCKEKSIESVLRRIKEGAYSVEKIAKLEAAIGRKKFLALNDVILRNKKVQNALRFSVTVGKRKCGEMIGDGVVVATPYGSTAYFHSITGRSFNSGVGIAFNNTTKRRKPIMTDGSKDIRIGIRREEAVLVFDNNPESLVLKPGQKVIIRKSSSKANIMHL